MTRDLPRKTLQMKLPNFWLRDKQLRFHLLLSIHKSRWACRLVPVAVADRCGSRSTAPPWVTLVEFRRVQA